MEKREHSLLFWILLAFVTVLYLMFALWRCSYISIDSDFSNLVLEGRDILQGDFFRHDWNLTGISFLTTDLLYYVVGVFFHGVSNQAYILACALMDTALVFSSFLLIKDAISSNRFLGGGILLVFAMLPCIAAIDYLRAHTGVFVLGFILIGMFFIMVNHSTLSFHSGKWMVLAYIIILALADMGDPIVLLLTVFPICLWSVMKWIRNESTFQSMLFSIIINGAGLIFGTVFDKLYFLIGGANKNSFLSEKTFASFEEMGQKLIIYFRVLLRMADAAFEDQPLLQLRTLFFAIYTLAIIVFFFLIAYNIICFFSSKRSDSVVVVLGIGFLALSAVFICTSVSVDVNSGRYLCYFPVLMAVVFIRSLSLISERNRFYYLIVVLIVIVFLGRVYSISNDIKPDMTDQLSLVETLENHGLSYGYSSFWNASSTTVLSNEKEKVRAVICDGSSLMMFNWFCRNDWYTQKANYVITTHDDIFGITQKNVETILGPPSSVIESGKYIILVFDYDISSVLS